MKQILILSALLLCCSAMAQTSNVIVLNPVASLPSGFSPGDKLTIDANKMLVRDTNSVALTVVPIADRIQQWIDMVQNFVIGIGAVLLAAATVWAKIKTTQASVVPTLIKTVETHGTPALKQAIEQASLRAGVEPAMKSAVKENTASVTPSEPWPRVSAAPLPRPVSHEPVKTEPNLGP